MVSKALFFLFTMAGFVAVLSGCGNSAGQTPVPAVAATAVTAEKGKSEAAPKREEEKRVPDAAASEDGTPEPTAMTAELREFSGSGPDVSPQVELVPGLAIFQINHVGKDRFAVWLLDSQGEKVQLLASTFGDFQGSKAVGVQKNGAYVLDIEADGTWTVSLEQPSATESLPAPPQKFAGDGPEASPLFTLEGGPATFRLTHGGSSNFVIWLLNAEGARVEMLVNEIGRFDGSKAIKIEEAGAYVLDVFADGAWVIQVEQ